MKRFIATSFAIVCILNPVFAQTPQFKCTKYSGTGISPANIGFTGIQGKYQSIFYSSNFPGISAGNMTAIYLRVGQTFSYASPAVYNNLSVKIGYTTDSFWNLSSTVYDTFKTGLTTILNATTFTVQGSDTTGKWFKIPVDIPFSYDPNKMMVVEVAWGPKPNNTGFDLMASNTPITGTKPRTLGGHRDSVRSKGSGTIGVFLDLGVDLAAKTSAGSASMNMREALVQPNPAKGLVNVSFSSRQAVNDLSITVFGINGAQVLRRSYAPQGTAFHTALDMSNLPPGVYKVCIAADGEVAYRSLLLQ